jgi:hypothetical protein
MSMRDVSNLEPLKCPSSQKLQKKAYEMRIAREATEKRKSDQ